ncbi:hypothetical protein CI109_103763 [Kwoniella shandongensis]|uniref:Uncharacterized protein n=1 Tax=Kwoniella shandongensis TaxID=1734106 RepID=A0A5M6C770_9TREE|nr:uncharacterized protein CI109_000540 [Kwoniella shandongensis]KAA5530968.1 hypothetical protein CI109_000540 [Kwoniella shandongensis]
MFTLSTRYIATLLPFLMIILIPMMGVKADNLFIGCGDEIDFIDMAMTTANTRICYETCRDSSYTYYTFRASEGVCACYTYPPPAAEYVDGKPGDCQGQLQYNLIKSNWVFDRCYSSINTTETPSDSFKACLDECDSHSIAIARPTGLFPGYTSCACGDESDLDDLVEATCDLDQYFVYMNAPTTTSQPAKRDRYAEIAARRMDA